MIALAHGLQLGWTAPTIPLLTSVNTPLLDGPITNVQVSWIGSIGAIGVIFGSFTYGFLTSIMGCKRATVLVTIPSIGFWVLIYFGHLYYHILLAKFLSGVSFGGMQTTVVLFISEISNDSIRGRLDCVRASIGDIGILFGYIFGSFVDYQLVPLICVSVPVLFAIIFITLPNTTQYYLSKRQFQCAEYAFKYYKGYSGRNQYEENAFFIEFERMKLIASKKKEEKRLQFSDFCK